MSYNCCIFFIAIKQTGELCRCSKKQRTYLICLLTSSDMSVLHASHVYWTIPSPTIKNRGLGPLGPSILDPIYVIYAFGSMLSCILCEKQKFSESHKWPIQRWKWMLSCILCEWHKFSESHKLKRFGARNQFRAARFVTISFIESSLNAMELVVRN